MAFLSLFAVVMLSSCTIQSSLSTSSLPEVPLYTNPTQGHRDSPDPGVIHHNYSFFAVTTGGWDNHFFPIWHSQDLTGWEHVGWGMGSSPSWTSENHWAPEIHKVDGRLNLYYTSRDKKTGRLCIGVRTAAHILGPWVDLGTPLHQHPTLGIIDATIMWVETRPYLVWKVDGNAVKLPTPIYAAPLDSRGTRIEGNETLLITDDQSWEHGIVEGPWILQPGGTYTYLFYSGCGYASPCYGVGVARANHPLGPYEKFSGNPILHTRDPDTPPAFEGPGHCSVLPPPPGAPPGLPHAIVYHAWRHGEAGKGHRVMMLDALTFGPDDWPIVGKGFPSENHHLAPF